MFPPYAKGHVYIIAEIGTNHDGKPEKAKQLIDIAAEAGADAVKFQLFSADEIVTEHAPLAMYQKRSGEESQYRMLERLMLSHDDVLEYKLYTESKGLDFLATPFDAHSAEFLVNIGLKVLKIPSGEITNTPFMEAVAQMHTFSIISTGMATLEEIQEAITPFEAANTPYALLHCISAYPTPVEEIHLRAMQTMQQTFNVPIGFSDHTEGILIPIAAVAMGARILEKHFTIRKSDPGPDHAASLEPDDLIEMVRSIRMTEKALGIGDKVCQPCERNTRDVARRSIVLVRAVQKGEVLTRDMLAIKRPGTGIAPKMLSQIIGKTVANDLEAGAVLTNELFDSDTLTC